MLINEKRYQYKYPNTIATATHTIMADPDAGENSSPPCNITNISPAVAPNNTTKQISQPIIEKSIILKYPNWLLFLPTPILQVHDLNELDLEHQNEYHL